MSPRPVILLLLLAVLAGGCAIVSPAGSRGPLVTVESRGGECFKAPCGSKIAIERDGRVHRMAPDAAEMYVLPADAVAALDGAIRATDFAVLKSKPFTGECPVNFDGQEVIYEFAAPSGLERIASCEIEIDLGHPLFVAVEAALSGPPS